MPRKQHVSTRLTSEPDSNQPPLLPTVVVASYKGGVWKTSFSVAIAERLAWAGQRVLMLTVDSQEDARARLGVLPSDPAIARKAFGHSGSVTVMGLRGSKAIDVLYRFGPEQLGLGTFDIAVVDTPPEAFGGSLPGVLLITTVDGGDAARNLVKMLAGTPANSDVILVHVGEEDPEHWVHNVAAIEEACGRPLEYLDEPVPRSKRIAEAHSARQSVWTLPRRGPVQQFLEAAETLSRVAFSRISSQSVWTGPPPPAKAGVFVSGWDNET